jgi:competence ComEA-like helix-hairpin-helix protein
MNWKDIARDYFSFSRKDRIGILVLCGLLFFVILLPRLVRPSNPPKGIHQDSTVIAALKKIEDNSPSSRSDDREKDDETYFNQPTLRYTKSQASLFYFDPNTLPADQWKKLGLRDKTIHTIQNFLIKGGKFKTPADLQRVYGLHKDEYERLAPYIRIDAVAQAKAGESYPRPSLQKPHSKPAAIDINSSDTSAFIALPGIGSKLALRIVSFREKLGGFFAIDQVAETFGLQDSVFQKIKSYLKLENVSVKKINVNTATLDELKAHPYIRWAIANPIIAYRNEHGPFANIEDLKKVMAVTVDIYNKIAPYLILQ